MEIALKHSYRKFLSFIDFLSTLLVLAHTIENIKTNSYILETKRKISEFCVKVENNNSIKLYWIPVHIEIRGNKEVDKLTKIVTNTASTDLTKISFTDLTIDEL